MRRDTAAVLALAATVLCVPSAAAAVRSSRVLGAGETALLEVAAHDELAFALSWNSTKTAGPAPMARKAHSATVVRSKMFVYGGSTEPAHRCFDQLFVLDFDTMVWSEPAMVSTRPPALMGHTGTHVARKASATDLAATDYVYVLGGFTFSVQSGQAESSTWHSDLWVLNTKELTWEHGSFSGAPMSPRHGHTATLVGNRVYVFGGYTESGMADNSVLALKVEPDEATGKYKWETVHVNGNKPSSRQGHVAGLLASRYLVVFGGYQGEGGQSLTDVHVLDVSPPEEDGTGFSWSVPIVRGGDNRPSPREDMSATVLPGRTEMAVIGGCTYPSGSCFNDVHVLAVEGGEWSWLPTRVVAGEAPAEREEHTAVLVPRDDIDSRETEVLVFGGGMRDAETFADARVVVLEARNTTCPEGCSGHGTCDLGACACDEGFFGPICSKFCLNDCSGHGACNRGTCECEAGWTGEGCGRHVCPRNCSGHGACDQEREACECEDAWYGAACNKTCAPACGAHGKCLSSLECECEEGYRGDACDERVTCPHDCSGHGQCDRASGECGCDDGFRGAACGKRTCPGDCSGHGECGDDGVCACAEHYDGEDCATRKHHAPKECPNDCSGHGACDTETLNCTCAEEHGKIWYGADCGEWTYRTVRLNFTVGPCTPNGYLTVPEHNQNFTLVMVQVVNADGVPEDVPCPVPDAPEVQLTATYSYTPEGVEEPVEVVVPLRRVGERLVMTPPDAPKSRVETAVASGSEAAELPAGVTTGLEAGSVVVLSVGTDNEETAVVREVRAAVGAEARFRAATTLAASAAAEEQLSEVVFTKPLTKQHDAPFDVAVAQTAPPPQALPEVDPPKPVPECAACDAEGGVCKFRDPDAAEPVSFCECNRGYSGAACDVLTCPNQCTSADHGECVRDAATDAWGCRCAFGYSGADCGEFEGCGDLGRHCGEHGTCELVNRTMSKGGVTKTHTFGVCHCHGGWRGPLCNVEACPRNCTADVPEGEHAHGECVTEDRVTFCRCRLGWSGAACDEPDPCPKNCSGHGACSSEDPDEVGRHCICLEGWSGDMCHHPVPIPGRVCPLNCSSNGACHDGQCACHRGWTGDACNDPVPCSRNCSNHGVCDLGVCECALGWSGEDCSVKKMCPNECSRRGRCVLGECVCAIGWTGDDCSTALGCPESCSGHGSCENGRCECDIDWSGDDCSIDHGVHCRPENCSGNGRCHFGKCYCSPGFEGEGCETTSECPVGPVTGGDEGNATCSGNGVCQFGKCYCAPGFEGDACAPQQECPVGHGGVTCSGQGYCDAAKGECFCAPGYQGFACERGAACPNNCSANGFCFNGRCECDLGYGGEDCAAPVGCPGATEDAPAGCSGNGQCLRGKCFCAAGFSGVDCANATSCPADCSDHGHCTHGVCLCDIGFQGESCDTPVACPDECNHRGVCTFGTCICHSGFSGPACELHMPCPEDCSGHGDCMQGECICDGGYEGIDCGQGDGLGHECPNNCTDHGACRDGVCSCAPGWTGRSCRVEVPCPMNCSGHGMCAHGDCFCDPGFEGRSCNLQVACPNECSGRGDCAHGRCFCQSLWTGEDCSERRGAEALAEDGESEGGCPLGHNNEPCSSHGSCRAEDATCICDDGWYGAACGSAVVAGECPNRCSGHGVCTVDGACECVPGFAGDDCSRVSETHLAALREQCGDCGEHGSCGADGTCHCDPNWTGRGCDEPICPNECSDNGLCTDGRCVCNAGFAADDCSAECPNRCSGHGTCSVKAGADALTAHCYCSPGWGGSDCSDMMTKREGMQMNSLLAVALGTFVVGLCAIPLVRTVQAQRALKERRHIIYGPQGMDVGSESVNPLNAAMHVPTA